MFKGVIAFLVGVYTGIYISQSYNVSDIYFRINWDARRQIPKVDDPTALYEKLKEFADKHRKS